MDGPLPDLARVTAAHLRTAETMCGLRLEREHAGARGNRGANARFAVANRVVDDARLAHLGGGVPGPDDFPVPTGFTVEQQRLYEAAAIGYRVCFGEGPARLADLDEWETALPDLGVRLVGDVGLAVETPGGPEVRALRIGRRGGGRPLVDDLDVRFTVLRAAPWVCDGLLRLRGADLLEGTTRDVEIDLAAALLDARAWLGERLEVIARRIATARPRVGADCAGCGFVAGCPAHRVDA